MWLHDRLATLSETLREFGPNIFKLLLQDPERHRGRAWDCNCRPGSPSVSLEDLMRMVLELRQEVIKLSERIPGGR